MNSFREFRDTCIKDNYPELIEEYYQIAPKIVKKIDEQPDKEKLYKAIWEVHLQKCLYLIETEETKAALEGYLSMVVLLKFQYLTTRTQY